MDLITNGRGEAARLSFAGHILFRPLMATFYHSSKNVFCALLVGWTLTGVVAGSAGYFLTLGTVRAGREKALQLKLRRIKSK